MRIFGVQISFWVLGGGPHFGGGLTMSGHHGDFSLFEACKEHVKHVKELHQCFNFTTIVIVSDNL